MNFFRNAASYYVKKSLRVSRCIKRWRVKIFVQLHQDAEESAERFFPAVRKDAIGISR